MTEKQTTIIPLLHSIQIADPALARAFEQLRQETQHYLALVSERLDSLAGLRGTPRIYADMEVTGHRIKDLAMPKVGTDAQRFDQCLHLASNGTSYDAGGKRIINVPLAEQNGHAVPFEQLLAALSEDLLGIVATAAPPEVEDASALGTVTTKLAREDHTHAGVNRTDAQTVGGAKTWSAKGTFSGEVEIDGAFNHDGTTFGALNTTPAVQQTASANLTDNTGAAADDTVENVPAAAGDGGGVATVSAAANVATVASVNTALTAIENDIADLTAKVNKALTVLRTMGFLAP